MDQRESNILVEGSIRNRVTHDQDILDGTLITADDFVAKLKAQGINVITKNGQMYIDHESNVLLNPETFLQRLSTNTLEKLYKEILLPPKKKTILEKQSEMIFGKLKWEGPMMKDPKAVQRNEKCPCGSNLKFKRCCSGKTPEEQQINLNTFGGISKDDTKDLQD